MAGFRSVGQEIFVDPITPSNVVAGGYVGFFSSENHGETWVLENSDFQGKVIFDVVISEFKPQKQYIAIIYDSIYRSVDRGRSWERLPEFGFGACGWVEDLALDPGDEDTIYALAGG